MINARQAVEAGETPEQITISMIDQDLKDGVSRKEMALKYSIKPWEVDEMFKHPLLTGRKPARKRILSFTFVDDMSSSANTEVNPNQVTLEQVIEESNEEVKANWDEHTKVEEQDDITPPTIEDTLELVEEQEMEAGTEEAEVEVEEDEFDSFQL